MDTYKKLKITTQEQYHNNQNVCKRNIMWQILMYVCVVIFNIVQITA